MSETIAPEAAASADIFEIEPPFESRGGFSWIGRLPAFMGNGDLKLRAAFRLFEDDARIMGSSSTMHADIAGRGEGRHVFWGDVVCFSTTDNSDPNTNGRRYSLRRVLDNPLGIWPLAGCTIYDPSYRLEGEGLGAVIARHVGYGMSPHTHTNGEHLQLIDYVRGAIDIPAELRPYCNIDFSPKEGGYAAALRELDVVLLEQCSDVEVVFRGVVLNRLRLADAVIKPAEDAVKAGVSDKRRLVVAKSWYYEGMIKASPLREQYAAEWLELTPRTDGDELLRDIVREATPRAISSEDFLASIARIRALLGKKLGVLTHTQRYMPDGRPLSWPPNLHDDLITLCRANDIPVMHPCELVELHGSKVALKTDLVHWHEDFIPVVAAAVYEFAKQVIAHQQ